MEKLFEETSIVQLVKFLAGHIVSELKRKIEPGHEANDFYYFGLELMLILNMMAFISDEIITEILFQHGKLTETFEFIKCLTQGDIQQKQVTLWFIGNAIGESRANAKILYGNLDIPAILYACMDVPTQFKQVVELVAWIICNLARHKIVEKKDLAMVAAILKYILNNFGSD